MEASVALAAFIAVGFLAWKYRREEKLDINAGAEKIVCPHCQTAGHITVRAVTRGKGIGGGKAASAVVTAGASIFAAGLSKNVTVRHLTCGNCKMEWDVA